MKSELFSYLDDVTFAEKDPIEIESEIISAYESITNRTLSRADPLRLFLNVIILTIIQQRNVIDKAAKNNLLAYSSGSYLDHLGALLGVTRLSASHAVCTLRFTLSQTQSFDVIIPSGTRVRAGDGAMFKTLTQGKITAGNTTCDISAESTDTGESCNGYIPGQINMLVGIFPYEMTARNITESNGGSDIESDENYRERIQIAPESFSSAGPVNAYAYYARSANPDIIDVSVVGPPETQPGHVEIYPLMSGGEIPGDEVLDAVYAVCNASDIRPDTDLVHVKKPVAVNYDLNVNYWIDERNSGSVYAIQAGVQGAIDAWVKWQRVKLGRDINVSELTRRIIEAGAKRCEIISPVFTVLSDHQVAILRNSRIIYKGLEEA